MSWQLVNPRPNDEPECPDDLEMVILPRSGDLGGFGVLRALPFAKRRLVGPFIFWDQMGPGEFLTGHGVDVRPHPHINLSTLTYLFDGALDHRDSLGTFQTITPGAVNLMTAGKGIVHSERTGSRAHPSRLYGIQSWLASPLHREEGTPSFQHIEASALPTFEEKGVRGRVLAGTFAGLHAPVAYEWDTLYVDIQLDQGQRISLPPDAEERAVYLLEGELHTAGQDFDAGKMLVIRPGRSLDVRALTDCRFLLLGGATMDGPRHIWWNFVASSQERIEQAKRDWADDRFAKVPGETEFIPLPAV
ncbi:MAG: pirin family protein [Candidatus Eremiobacteraeota bacterium]|nr:pirin family protein [Candidatus Eremiobacteraeota bacterium]